MPARPDRPDGAAAPAAPTGSAAFLAGRLRAVPPRSLAAVVLGCVAVGLLLGGTAGGILLALAIVLLAVLLAVGWGVMARPERLLRIAILVLLVCVSIVRVAAR